MPQRRRPLRCPILASQWQWPRRVERVRRTRHPRHPRSRATTSRRQRLLAAPHVKTSTLTPGTTRHARLSAATTRPSERAAHLERCRRQQGNQRVVARASSYSAAAPPLLVLSLDGFASKYQERQLTPSLTKFGDCGAQAKVAAANCEQISVSY